MLMTCGACGKEMELPFEVADGQRVKCPFCGERTVYRRPTRIEVPVGVIRESTKPRIGIRHPPEKTTSQNIKMEDKLRMAINPELAPPPMTPPSPPPTAPQGVVTAAEERVRMFEEMRQKNARTKMLRNFVESAMLLMLLAVLVGLALWWQSHKNKVAAEAARIEAEAEANRIRLAAERDSKMREQREKERLEREAARAKEREEQERIRQEQARRRQAEREERERAELELRTSKEQYHLYITALRENMFDMFVSSVTNGMDGSGGELCYLLPSTTQPIPLYHVVYETNGTKRVFKMYEDGKRDEEPFADFQDRISNLDYLVAKGGTVRFKSARKTPETGILSMAKEADPAETFFGGLAPVLKTLQPTYEELTFDIFFTPRGESKMIFVENVPFGCAWSFKSVRGAVEKAKSFMQNISSGSGSSSRRKFKRTVKLYNGAMIKKGVDGITYVPKSPPSVRYRETYTTTVPNCIYRSRSRTTRVENGYERWSVLYAEAQREDAEEAAYYDNERQRQSLKRDTARAAAEEKWNKAVDNILRDGTLSYKIRKAKVGK